MNVIDEELRYATKIISNLKDCNKSLQDECSSRVKEAKLRTSDSPIIGGGDEGQKSTNVEFPTNASQASEMINFSGGAISEILPVRGGEVVPIVAGNEKKMQSKLFELVDFLDPILQYLANDKALYPTLYFNRFWYCIAGQILWKHIELDYILSDNKINGIIQSCPNIVYLNFNAIGRLAISDTAIINIAHEYPNLLRLDLFECYISDTAIRAIACSCHNLQHLDLGLFRLISESTVRIIAHSCKNLRYLCLFDCSSITDNTIKEIANSCHKLEHLDIYDCGHVTDLGIRDLVRSCPKLKHLELDQCIIGNRAIKEIARKCINLKYLGLEGCKCISREAIERLNPNIEVKCPDLDSEWSDSDSEWSDEENE
ncbi:10062_t:CDS:2 [Entrophospora sp. SA101]|nr:10062_t:CDS:2 [Entrophospora sp. SA101]